MLRNRLVFEGRDPDACHLAILAGVHGDERAGFLAFDRLIERLHLEPLLRGRLSLIPGNLRAAGKKHPTRSAAGQDLNRLFLDPNDLAAQGLEACGPDWERAQELAKLLQEVDVLLDLHSTCAPSEPFGVTQRIDDEALALLAGFPINRVDYDYRGVLPGTTMAWVDRHGGRGFTVECGEHRQATGTGARRAFACSIALLRNLGMLAPGPMNAKAPTRRVRLVHRGVIRHPASLQYEPWFKSEAHVAIGAVLAHDRTGAYRAPTREDLEQIVGVNQVPDELVAVMVRPPLRVAQHRPHDAFLLGIPE
jgi:predicted deacylase